MPLRSVEAATRDDAIAAAREQFGASARVVGVRRVRSGGVLGFFATERYVAEVDPDQSARPAVPVPAPARPSSAAAAPQAPGHKTAGRVVEERGPAASDDDRLAELAGLLGGGAPTRTATPYRRPAAYADDLRPEPAQPPARDPFAERAATRGFDPEPEPEPVRPAVVRAATVRPAWSPLVDEDAGEPAAEPQPLGSAATPSPFTAALARMVSGDREVRQAVEEALAEPVEPRTTAAAGPWPSWSGPVRATETSVWSRAAHQEEEPVELQDYTPTSAPAFVEPPAAAPTWAAAPEAEPQPSSSREEAIAEVLRAALAQDRSDEALAGILRKVMDGASPDAALAEPAQAAVVAAPVVEEPVAEAPLAEEPVAEAPVVEEPVAEAPLAEEPVAEEPSSALFGGSGLGWDDEHSSSLWAEPAAPVAAPHIETAAEESVAVVEQTIAPASVEVPEQVEVVEVVVDDADEQMADADEQTDLSGLAAPVLARTASDPAPMSLDATTVMPPLSLLPPLPSSRQRGGRPPVPPSAGRASAAPVRTSKPPVGDEGPAPITPDRSEALATVTRLPLAPSEEMPAPAEAAPAAAAPATEAPATEAPATEAPATEAPATETPAFETPAFETPAFETPAFEMPVVEIPGVAAEATPAPVATPSPAVRTAQDTAVIAPVAPAAGPARDRAAARATARAAVAAPPAPVDRRPARPAAPARPQSVPAPAAPADADVVTRLTALGLPAELLGGAFAADVAAQGTYAALTRALAAGLPAVPELPAGAGEVLVVVGPGVETLRAARALAASLRLDPDRVQWASRGDLAALAPESSRMATIETAIDRRQDSTGSGTVTIVAIDAPLRTDAYWTAQMLAIWTPVAVWAVVEATRKPEDLEPWLDGLPRVDALMVQDSDLSADPAAVLRSVALPQGLPVATLDGVLATPHRWASLLCERLETPQA